MPQYLFAYGTLNPDLAPAEIADIVARFHHIGAGFVFGRLYDLGSYRGARPDESSESRIPGNLYRIPEDPDLLKRLDQYEGYDPENDAESLFVRLRISVFAGPERFEAWIYVYNGDLSTCVPINDSK